MVTAHRKRRSAGEAPEPGVPPLWLSPHVRRRHTQHPPNESFEFGNVGIVEGGSEPMNSSPRTLLPSMTLGKITDALAEVPTIGERHALW